MLASPPERNSKRGAQQAVAYHCGTTGQLSLSKKELLSSQLNSCGTQGLQHLSSLIVVYRKSNTKHKTCNNFMNVLPAADTMESTSQNSRTAE